MIVTAGMSDRKEILIRESDAFIILAGGFGTLDELLDVVTTKQLGYHDKPVAIVNTNGFSMPANAASAADSSTWRLSSPACLRWNLALSGS